MTRVIDSCVGCGLCGEVAHAAKLCPSFYRASIIENPTQWDRFKARLRDKVIGLLQRRLARKAAYGRQLTVRSARSAGASWTQIGAALGTTKQSAWEAHSRWIDQQASRRSA